MHALLCCLVVLAQTPEPTPPPAPPPAGQVPIANAPLADQPKPKPSAPPSEVLFRGGGSIGIGAFIPAPAVNFGIFEFRGGVHVNSLFGAYLALGLQGGIGLRLATGATSGSGGVSLNSMLYLAAVAELTLGDAFFIGAGPLIGNGAWGSLDIAANSMGSANAMVKAVAGWMPGVTGRIGVGFGSRGVRGIRSQWVLSFDFSAYFASGSIQAHAGNTSIGAELSDKVAVGYAPMLMFGHDWK